MKPKIIKTESEYEEALSRVESLMDSQPELPLIVMGDFNDDPGMDSYERFLGASSVETVMGSIYEPDRILHNALWHITKTDRAKELWTMAYPDLIIRNMDLHRAWLDHIFISPGMLDQSAVLKYVMDSGQIAEKDEAAAGRKQAGHRIPRPPGPIAREDRSRGSDAARGHSAGHDEAGRSDAQIRLRPDPALPRETLRSGSQGETTGLAADRRTR